MSQKVIFVAHDVGGPGGMERHAERLIERLLDAGCSVTVVARTCRMQARDGLRFRCVHAPAQPFTIAYPAFFAVASTLLARRGDAVLHTTGAVVANRADISTVHYCHRAAATRVEEPRASRVGAVYRVNARIAAILARAGERWCYSPRRTRLLCAVSDGVAAELQEWFPAIGRAIRSIPNGVDATVFRPDSAARAAVRDELRLPTDAPLALFVGGDWERKGLSYAVDALARAKAWHLAVAGPGDEAPVIARARTGGCGERLHLLGSVGDMPRVYAAADAFVFPTTYEAFPLVALEAAASGIPLLVTRVNGATELVREGETGWFIERDAGDIARRLNQLRDDPELARMMGSQAREAVLPYSWEAMAEGYLSLYAEVVEKAGGKPQNRRSTTFAVRHDHRRRV